MNLDNVFDIINAAITNFNQSTDQSYNFKFDEKAVLFGKGSVLDSIGLVNFVVAVEEEIENSTGKIIVLGEDIALTSENSPFSSIKALAEYIYNLIKE